MTIRRAVVSYPNPDTDGVACMIAYKELVEATVDGVVVEPVVFGALNAETRAVLEHLRLEAPAAAVQAPTWMDQICLVDTHHRAQLPPSLPVERVVEVIDHHPGGDVMPERASVQNEMVGAAATLLTERFREANRRPANGTAALLGAAILSNTLDLTAPSTTERDVAALKWLEEATVLPYELISAMHRGREQLIDGSTTDVLLADVKLFTLPSGRKIAMSQVEAPNASALGDRQDLADAVSAVAAASGASDVIVNLADITLGCSLLVCPDPALQQKLQKAFGVSFDCASRAWTQVLFLRKTHLVPVLMGG